MKKTLQKPRINFLSEKLIQLVCHEKTVNDKQCTILCHVEYLKLSHVDPNIFSSVLAKIDAEYGNIEKMIITQGKIHKYLRMTID